MCADTPAWKPRSITWRAATGSTSEALAATPRASSASTISRRCGRMKGPSPFSGASRRAASLGSAVFAATGAGFMNEDARQAGEPGLELAPDPHGQHLAGGILESRDLVQVTVIEGLEHLGHRLAQVGEIAHPAGLGRHRPRHVDADDKGMAVQPGALVPCGHVGQAVRGLDAEGFEDLH